MPTPPHYVLTGGPCSGKTTLINELKDRGYSVLPESARTVIAAELAAGKTIEDILADPLALEHSVLAHQLELYAEAPKDQLVFIDRGVPDNVAYYRKFNMPIDDACWEALESVHYRKVFLLDMIDFDGDAERYEQNPEEAAWLHAEIRKAYTELGYAIIEVPVLPITERADFILARID